jgi:hypothetical protein
MRNQLLKLAILEGLTDIDDWLAYVDIEVARDNLVIQLCERGIEATYGNFETSLHICNFRPFHETIINMLLSEHGAYYIELREHEY